MDKRHFSKAISDPQISLTTEKSNSQVPHYMMAVSGDIFPRRATYGSLDTSLSTPGPSVCCVAGEHLLTTESQEFIRRSLSLNSVVHVDISDINGDGESPIIPLSLRKCKKMILTPYTLLLSIIGWRPWFKDSLANCSVCWGIINIFYPSFVIFLMIYHFVFQILSCQGKYNIHSDTMTTLPTPSAPTVVDARDGKTNCSYFGFLHHNCPDKHGHSIVHEAYCLHIVPTYIVPSLMYFLAFAYGFLHFRLQECEQLYSLMERVFLQAYSTPGVQSILIRNSRLYLVGAFLWLLLQFTTELLYSFTFDIKIRLIEEFRPSRGWFLFLLAMKFAGLMLVQCVNVAVVLNYCMQCEMLVFHIKGICLRLNEKSIEIQEAMHEILGVRACISSMNERMGRMVAFCVVNFAELTIVGTALLFLNQNKDDKVLTYRGIFPAMWFAALIIPLLQAARLTRVGTKLRQISFEMRVFGYQMASQLELDSFVLFVNGATLRAKLFGVTISPASIILTFGGAIFIILTLMVVDLVTISGYKSI